MQTPLFSSILINSFNDFYDINNILYNTIVAEENVLCELTWMNF